MGPYLRSVQIKNVRSIRQLEWSLPAHIKDAVGWHVILGNNGAGKSTFLKSLALTLLEPDYIAGLRQDWNRWLNSEADAGHIKVQTHPAAPGGLLKLNLTRSSEGVRRSHLLSGRTKILQSVSTFDNFTMGFGPFRRFTSGVLGTSQESTGGPRLDRFLSLFDDSFTFGQPLEWLKLLKFQQLENRPSAALLDRLKAFINQPEFLPFGTQLQDVSSDAVLFRDGNGQQVSMLELSDGFRSILCLTLELIRQLVETFGSDKVFDPRDPTVVKAAGVVLIDEIDVHLHPRWQRQIGVWFREHFPNVQFIVTTHSPLICQAAEMGTVFSLPEPGEEGEGRMITGLELRRLVYGDVLEAYGTEAFDMGGTRSETANSLLEQLAPLNVKQARKGLSDKETRQLHALRATFPTESYPGNGNGAADT